MHSITEVDAEKEGVPHAVASSWWGGGRVTIASTKGRERG